MNIAIKLVSILYPRPSYDTKLITDSIKARRAEKLPDLTDKIVMVQDGKEYRIIAGGTRFTALCELGVKTLDDAHCSVIGKRSDFTEEQLAMMSMDTNMARNNPSPLAVLMDIQKYVGAGFSKKSMAAIFGIPQTAVGHIVKMKDVIKPILKAFDERTKNLTSIMDMLPYLRYMAIVSLLPEDTQKKGEQFLIERITWTNADKTMLDYLESNAYDLSKAVFKPMQAFVKEGVIACDTCVECTCKLDKDLLGDGRCGSKDCFHAKTVITLTDICKEKFPDAPPLYVCTMPGTCPQFIIAAFPGVKWEHEFTKAKKGDGKAVDAFVVHGPGVGTKIAVVIDKEAVPPKKSAGTKDEKKPVSDEDKAANKALLAKARHAQAFASTLSGRDHDNVQLAALVSLAWARGVEHVFDTLAKDIMQAKYTGVRAKAVELAEKVADVFGVKIESYSLTTDKKSKNK